MQYRSIDCRIHSCVLKLFANRSRDGVLSSVIEQVASLSVSGVGTG